MNKIKKLDYCKMNEKNEEIGKKKQKMSTQTPNTKPQNPNPNPKKK